MALLQSIGRWLSSSKTDRKLELKQRSFRLTLEGLEDRLLLSSSPVSWQSGGLSGQWFVQSDGLAASITQSGSQLTLTNEYGQQTSGQWLSAASFSAWGQTAQIVQNGAITQILWNGNAWSQSTWEAGGLSGQWFVQSNGLAASISQSGTQLTLTNEQGQQTTGQWLSPTTFSAWGTTAQIVQNGPITQILWNGNAWSQSTWDNGGLSGQWFVQSNGLAASITQSGTQLTLTNEQGQQTTGQWLSPTTFSAWGTTAQVVQNGALTQILWNGNAWSQSSWQDGGLNGRWFVQSNGLAASISESGTQLTLTNGQGQQTAGQWLSPTTFSAWGQTAQIVQNGALTQILWNGNAWSQSTWQDGGLAGQWFVQSNGLDAIITQSGAQLSLTNEQGQQTAAQWLSPTSFEAWGQTAQIVQNGAVTQILWNGNPWSQSKWQDGGLNGQWFVQSNGLAASITQNGTQLTLTNEYGQQTSGQWLSATSFSAWGQTAQVVQNGAVTQILWNGNTWSQSTWQDGGLNGQWFVQSNGLAASIAQYGTELLLTNEQGQQTAGQWLSPTSFEAWGQVARIVQNGAITQILWNGNAWSQSTWQDGGLAGQWFVQSNGLPASIAQSGTQLLLTNEQGQQTTGQWLSPTSFEAWGHVARIVQNGTLTQILWNGNAWSQAPSIGSTASTTFAVGQPGTFTVTTRGFSTAALTESGTLPAGVSFTDNGNGTATLSGTPAAGTASLVPYSFTISAGNSPSSVTEKFMLTVDQPPIITSAGSATFTMGQAGSFTITATSGLPAATTLSESGNLPSGVIFTPGSNGTATLHGIPAAGTGGTYALTLTASNAAGSQTTQTFTLNVNSSPTITSAASATFMAGQAASFTVTTRGFPAAALTASGTLPGGVTFTDNGNGTATLSGTPPAGSASFASFIFTITAADGIGSGAAQIFRLTVDQPPTITNPGSAAFTVGQAGSFTVTTTPGLPATTALSESGKLPSGVTFTAGSNGTATLHGTPAAGTAGNYIVILTASNAAGSQTTQTFTLNVNQFTTITSAASATFVAGQAGSFTVTTKGFPTAALTESGTLPAGVTFTDNGNGTATLSGTPAVGSGGSYSFTILAGNSVSSAAQTFKLTVNQPPTITSTSSADFTVGQAGSFTVTTTPGLPATATTLSESGKLPSGVTFTAGSNGTATLHGTPAAGTGGSYSITLTASNAVGAQMTQTFTLNVNQFTTITSAASATFVAGQAGSFTVTTKGFPAAALTVSGTLPAGVTFTDNGNGTATLSGTPAAGSGGPYSFTILAGNSVSSAAQTFKLMVD